MDGITAIRRLTGGWNDRCEPFTWTKAAGEILAEAIRRLGTLRPSVTKTAAQASASQPGGTPG